MIESLLAILILVLLAGCVWLIWRNEAVARERHRANDHVYGCSKAMLRRIDPKGDTFIVDLMRFRAITGDWRRRLEAISYGEMLFSFRPVDSFYKDLDADMIAAVAEDA